VAELVRRVGLGVAARGSVSDVVGWAERAARAGLDSLWVHDSYFERDAVTYASAIAAQVDGLGVGLGAVNPLTRHPVVLAMTVSALDEMAPGRVRCALGTGLPLRLGQMGVPYTPAEGIDRVGQALDVLRSLWRGDRLPPGTPGFPPLAPMFPPVHHTPLYVAGYRRDMVELAGAKADGYLARPAESVPGLAWRVRRLREAARQAGRDPADVDVAGYLLSLVEPTRRGALNRAKREPFVIYMLSILSDASLAGAGFPLELRDRVAKAWAEEEYHQAAELIPDELVDAFLLCGTAEDVAARVWDYRQAGLDLPLLQPVVQERDQLERVLAAAVAYGSAGPSVAATATAAASPADAATATAAAASRADAAASPTVAAAAAVSPAARRRRREPWPARTWRRVQGHVGAWAEITRPFSLSASAVPVATGAALAATKGPVSWALSVGAFVAAVLLQVGTNVVNEIYDVRKGVDDITSPRASQAILKGRIGEREAFGVAGVALAAAAGLGVWVAVERGWLIALLGVIGAVGGVGYTAPPLQLKYRALGLPLVFVLMGPLMVEGGYLAASGHLSPAALALSLPVGLLVAAILQGNEWRDIGDDARAGILTASIRLGDGTAHLAYLALVVGAYLALAAAILSGVVPRLCVAAVLSLPFLVRVLRASELGARGERRRLAKIDLTTAQLHAAFGTLLVAGLAAAAA
jgi:1,4-dihydroxy-2-naphthoate octaprenyltransferase